jgi:hypothetical protein
METELALNISIKLTMAFAAEAHLKEGQLQLLASTLNQLKSLKLRCGTHRSAVFSKEGQYLEPLKHLLRRTHLNSASEQPK